MIAAKQATSVIPIVFAVAGDPVGTGLVASLARPGGNVTGLSNQSSDLAGKRLELLRELSRVSAGWRSWPMSAVPSACWRWGRFRRPRTPSALEVARLEIRRAEDIASAIDDSAVDAEAGG